MFVTPTLRRISRLIPSSLRSKATWIFRIGIAPFLKGNRLLCPCCGSEYRQFLAMSGTNTKNTMCPGCGSLTRHRLIWLYLKNETDIIQAPSKLLHVSPEIQLTKNLLKIEKLEYLSIDLNSPLAMMKMDVTNLELPSESFDSIICSHVLNHVEDDQKALLEFYRVLKPGGWAILQSPVEKDREKTWEDPKATTPKLRKKIYGQSDLVRRYGRDYTDRIAKAGFEVSVINYPAQLGDEMTNRHSLNPDSNLYLCKKISKS